MRTTYTVNITNNIKSIMQHSTKRKQAKYFTYTDKAQCILRMHVFIAQNFYDKHMAAKFTLFVA